MARMSGLGVKYWPAAAIHVLGVLLQEALVDGPLDIHIKAKAVLGIIFSCCKIDMETVAHLHDKLSKESENLDECI